MPFDPTWRHQIKQDPAMTRLSGTHITILSDGAHPRQHRPAAAQRAAWCGGEDGCLQDDCTRLAARG
jgi:hypothetical protein